MPADMQGCLIFHYNLKFYDSEEDSFDTVSLKRFVMQVRLERRLSADEFLELNTFYISVGHWQHCGFPSSRALFWCLSSGHICECGDATRVLDGRADEIQVCVQIQGEDTK